MRKEELADASIAIRDVLLGLPEVGRAAVVAAYVGVGTEPDTGPLIDALARRGIRILLPVVMRERDLDWAPYVIGGLARSSLGVMEPTGGHLGPTAIASADAILVPGLAVDRSGVRLGRGGGSYDRALARVAPDAFVCAILHDGEVLNTAVPREPHDRAVQAAATPSGLVRFT